MLDQMAAHRAAHDAGANPPYLHDQRTLALLTWGCNPRTGALLGWTCVKMEAASCPTTPRSPTCEPRASQVRSQVSRLGGLQGLGPGHAADNAQCQPRGRIRARREAARGGDDPASDHGATQWVQSRPQRKRRACHYARAGGEKGIPPGFGVRLDSSPDLVLLESMASSFDSNLSPNLSPTLQAAFGRFPKGPPNSRASNPLRSLKRRPPSEANSC